jgi:protein-S-isoprenylcysteine O-methyltransferase Ste14
LSPIGVGGWLFANRGWLPLPIFVAQLVLGGSEARECGSPIWVGLTLIALGEALRIWSVGYIGIRSRTLGDEVTGVEVRGPYGLCRNPLYIANIAIWGGVGLLTSWLWLCVWLLVLIPYYSAIVRYEESNLHSVGESYSAYFTSVDRWLPRKNDISELISKQGQVWSFMSAIRSERTTLCAISAILISLYYI